MANLFTAFAGLSPRNKIVALTAVGLVIVLILFLPLSLLSGKVSSLKNDIAAAQKGYSQVVDKLTEYQRVKGDIAALEARFGQPSGSLTSRVENIAKESDITVDQLREKAPQETDYFEINSVEVKISNISLTQVMEFLHNIEQAKTAPMRIKRIQIKPKSANRQMLDISCDIATYILKKEV